MKDRIGVIQFGIGPIGQAILRDLLKKGDFRIVGAVDVDKEKVGRDLADLVGLDTPLGVTVSSNSAEVLSDEKARLVTLSTVSSLVACYPQIEEIVEAGKYLISTCEELAYPWLTHPELSRQIDDRAKRTGVAVLGTGVNPGFAMDYLPIVVSGICSRVERIKVSRIQVTMIQT
ncbi:MAG: hypothetical protein GTN81_17505 [Proteobacteria bacterium]|nr:hypothetical protein [Pseudomonadota bacterium]